MATTRGIEPGPHWNERVFPILSFLLAGTIILSTVLAQAFAIMLIVLWVLPAPRTARPFLTRTVFDLPLLAFVIARALSIVLSQYPGTSLRALRTEIPFYALYFALSSRLDLRRPNLLRNILWSLLAAGTLASVYGAVRVLTGLEPRAISTTSGYVTLGMYLTAVFGLILPLGDRRDLFPNRWAWGAAALVLLVGIVLTFNRIHWGVALIALLLIGSLREWKLLAAGAVLLLLAVILVPSVSSRFRELVFFASHLSGRDVIWRGAWLISGGHPLFGYGIGTFRQIFPLFAQLPDQGVGGWHSDYIQIYIESGLVGIAAMGWLVVAICRHGLRSLRRGSGDGPPDEVAMGLAISLSMCLVCALVGGVFFDPLIALLFYLLLALFARAVPDRQVRGGAGA
jgi:O-antigen ligase